MKIMKKIIILASIIFLVGCDKGANNLNSKKTVYDPNNFCIDVVYFSESQGTIEWGWLPSMVLLRNMNQVQDVIDSFEDESAMEVNTKIESFTKGNDKYFKNKSILIVPFVYSSSETGIELTKIDFDSECNQITAYFLIFSPELFDYDLYISVYIIEIENKYIKEIDLQNIHSSISVFNVRDESDKSVYY